MIKKAKQQKIQDMKTKQKQKQKDFLSVPSIFAPLEKPTHGTTVV